MHSERDVVVVSDDEGMVCRQTTSTGDQED